MSNPEIMYKQARRLLARYLKAGQAPMLHGPPGIGKTALGNAVAKEAGYDKTFSICAIYYDPTDVNGIPYPADDPDFDIKVMGFLQPDYWPKPGDKTLFIIDDLPNASQMTQNSFYQLIHERRVGKRIFPDTCGIMACGNRVEDKCGIQRMTPALRNRMTHINLGVDAEAWTDWAIKAGIAPEHVALIRWKNDLLWNFDPKSPDNAFPTPRSNEMLDKVRKTGNIPPEDELDTYAGVVGYGAAMEHVAFYKMHRDLPDIDSMLADPQGCKLPERLDVLYAISTSLGARCNEDNYDRLIQIVERLRTEPASDGKIRGEFAMVLLKDCQTKFPDIVNTIEFANYVSKHLEDVTEV